LYAATPAKHYALPMDEKKDPNPFAQLFKACPREGGELAAGGMLFFVFLNDQREWVVNKKPSYQA